MTEKRDNWGSRFGFIMTAAGFSIGLGNMWRFPYLVGTEGGGAFVLVYLLIALIIGIPLFTMEMSLGRKAQASPIVGMRKLKGKGSPWVLFGWLGVLAAFFILTYYLQIMGWILAYFYKVIAGAFDGKSVEQVTSAFDTLRANPGLLLGLTLACVVIVGLISAQGLEKGVERACKIMMPALFVMILIMVIRSLTLPGAWAGVKWYLTPDFSKITGKTLLNALGQSFFSIGIASGGAFIYGSYLREKNDIPSDGLIIVGFDTLAAILAGFIIFPAIFSMGMEPGQGAGLLFVTMSKIFADMPLGNFFGGIFFTLVFFAALSSALGYLEPVATSVRDLFKIERKKAVWTSLAAIFIVGIPTCMAFGPWKDVRIFGMNLFDADDFWSGNILMPLGAILLIAYVIFQWKFNNFRDDANVGTAKIRVAEFWKPTVFIIIPIALVVIFVMGVYNTIFV